MRRFEWLCFNSSEVYGNKDRIKETFEKRGSSHSKSNHASVKNYHIACRRNSWYNARINDTSKTFNVKKATWDSKAIHGS